MVGWIEGFKAHSDLYCVGSGVFRAPNPDALKNSEVICKDPYSSGWLYRFEGKPDEGTVDVEGYMSQLETTIDKMLEKPWKSGDLQSGEAAS